MKLLRRPRLALTTASFCAIISTVSLLAQQQTPPPPAAPPPGRQTPLETPRPPATTVQPSGQLVESIVFRGARRVPQDTLKYLISTKAGDVYSEEGLRSDLAILWKTRRFDDIRVTSELGRTGVIITFELTEWKGMPR